MMKKINHQQNQLKSYLSMTSVAIFLPMLIMGLVSSAHCIGMCGGIMGALTMAIPADAQKKRFAILFTYNMGRIFSYTLMGFLAGFLAKQFSVLGGVGILRIMAGLLLIAMGLYLANWWRGLTYLEKAGRTLWVYLQPLSKPLLPVNNLPKAFLLGTVWGWLPCGLVYAALALAMTQPAPLLGAGSMLAFGIGTLPAVLAAGAVAQWLTKMLQQKHIRIALAMLLIVYGLWTLVGGLNVHSHHHRIM
jgi:uncharacterized protein